MQQRRSKSFIVRGFSRRISVVDDWSDCTQARLRDSSYQGALHTMVQSPRPHLSAVLVSIIFIRGVRDARVMPLKHQAVRSDDAGQAIQRCEAPRRQRCWRMFSCSAHDVGFEARRHAVWRTTHAASRCCHPRLEFDTRRGKGPHAARRVFQRFEPPHARSAGQMAAIFGAAAGQCAASWITTMPLCAAILIAQRLR